MAAITQIVDEQLKQIRAERAELDELRASLERRESELDDGSMSERKQDLSKELEELSAEVKRLRAERDNSIGNFGDELSKVHSEKSAQSAATVKQLQGEINFLLKGKTELEEELETLREKLKSTDEKSKQDLTRITEEKDAHLNRTRTEREAEMKEINLAHSVAVAELDRRKKDLENEINALEQTKTIEWNKIQAEISRYKTTQLEELDATREQSLAELEKEKSSIATSIRAKERKQRDEITEERRAWEKEILKLQTEKQKILDDIKLHEYDFEKTKADSIVKFEKARVDEEKAIEARRAEAVVALEEEQSAITADFKKQAAEQKKSHRMEVIAAEKEIAAFEVQKAAIISEINGLEARFEQIRAENNAALESLRLEKLKEIDELRVTRLREIEDLRHVRISALEEAFLEKSKFLENARTEKLEEVRKAIKAAEDEFSTVQKTQIGAEDYIKLLQAETVKIQKENEALKQAAVMEKRLELEKMTNDKLAEIEKICKSRIATADERAQKIEAETKAKDEKLSAGIAESTETLLELRKMITAQNIEMQQQKDAKLEEIELETIIAMEEFSKMRRERLAEIETSLDEYQKKRMESIQLAVESDMRVLELKNAQITTLQERNAELETCLANSAKNAAKDTAPAKSGVKT